MGNITDPSGRRPTRIALAGDWHGNAQWALRAIEAAARQGCDTLVHLGDFGLWPGRDGARYLADLTERLARLRMALYWVDGNHDDHAAIAAAPLVDGVHPITERIVHLPRGFRWTWHGRVWLAVGGAVSIDRNSRIPTRSWWAEEVVSDADVAACIAGGPADVVVAHDCPAGAPTVESLVDDPVWNLPPDIEADSAANRRRIRTIVDAVRPHAVFHGHYHRAYRESLVLADGTARSRSSDSTATEHR